ncbi:MAG: DMT family transporter [Bacteroidetes bacterium]|jgi:drug/metabolite transporter (DMT)-like permease|nr:DMT family transporter [Bacteroidota bacterium]
MKTAERSTLIKGSIAIAISAVLWGVDGVVLTPQLYNLDVGYVVFILHAFPFLLMHLFFARQYRFIKKMPRQDVITFLLISILGGSIGTLAIVKALFLLNFNHLSVVVLLQKLQPVFAILLARTLLGEQLKQRFVLWASLAIFAGYFLTFGWAFPDFNADKNTIYAALLALLAAFSFGSSTVLSKKILGNYSFITSTFYRYGFTTLIMLLYMVVFGNFGQFQQTTPTNWLFIIIIGLTTGSGAIFLYYYGLRKVKAIMATISELMFPLSAVIFDYLINGSVLSLVQWIAAALMLFSIFRLNAEPEKVN